MGDDPSFTYAECPECGFSSVTRDGTVRFWDCPLCAGDSGHDVLMNRRPARPEDEPEGRDARRDEAQGLRQDEVGDAPVGPGRTD